MTAAEAVGTDLKSHVKVGALIGGKYRVERVIAEGRMGIVVRAMNLEQKERVALKVLHPALQTDEGAFTRFRQEAYAVTKLANENVARTFDVVVSEGEPPFVVMELLDGVDLDALVQLRGQLAPEVATNFIRQACSGVGAAHKAGILHRDLKPANLFLAKKGGASAGDKGGGTAIKVLDYGLVKVKPERGEGVKLTQEKDVFGTPSYMSPEQINAEILDERTDVWSLGAVLYELVTGRTAFGADTVAQTLVNISIHQPPPLDTFAADVPEGLQEVVSRALAKDRGDRYQTVDALAEALAPFAKETDVAALLPDRPVSIAPPPPPKAAPAPGPVEVLRVVDLPPPRAPEITMPTLEGPRGGGGTQRIVFIAIAIGAVIGGLLAALLLGGNGGASTPAPSASAPTPLAPSASQGRTTRALVFPQASAIPHANVDSLPPAPK
jgi:serine/threonine-protein kinase